MGNRAIDIVLVEPAIELHRRGEALHERISGFAEAAAPKLAGVFGLRIVWLVAHGWHPLRNGFGRRCKLAELQPRRNQSARVYQHPSLA